MDLSDRGLGRFLGRAIAPVQRVALRTFGAGEGEADPRECSRRAGLAGVVACDAECGDRRGRCIGLGLRGGAERAHQ